jgi:hypothetical protein
MIRATVCAFLHGMGFAQGPLYAFSHQMIEV